MGKRIEVSPHLKAIKQKELVTEVQMDTQGTLESINKVSDDLSSGDIANRFTDSSTYTKNEKVFRVVKELNEATEELQKIIMKLQS